MFDMGCPFGAGKIVPYIFKKTQSLPWEDSVFFCVMENADHSMVT